MHSRFIRFAPRRSVLARRLRSSRLNETIARRSRSSPPPTASIDLASERFIPKNLWTERTAAERPQLVGVRDENGQADYIVARVLENREGGTMLKQQAVLFRAAP